MKYENQPPGPTCALEKAQIVQLGSYINKYIYILYFILGPRPRNLNLYYKIIFFFWFCCENQNKCFCFKRSTILQLVAAATKLLLRIKSFPTLDAATELLLQAARPATELRAAHTMTILDGKNVFEYFWSDPKTRVFE